MPCIMCCTGEMRVVCKDNENSYGWPWDIDDIEHCSNCLSWSGDCPRTVLLVILLSRPHRNFFKANVTFTFYLPTTAHAEWRWCACLLCQCSSASYVIIVLYSESVRFVAWQLVIVARHLFINTTTSSSSCCYYYLLLLFLLFIPIRKCRQDLDTGSI